MKLPKRLSFKISALIIGIVLLNYSCNSSTDTVEENEDVAESVPTETIKTENKSSSIEDLVNAKDESKLNESQLIVQGLIEACVSGDYATAASFIMYRGKDETRMGYDSFNYENANEANTVKVTCEVVLSWLGSSESYEFISFQEEETEFGLQYVVEVLFTKEKLGIERHFFYLMDTPKGKLLVNMV